MFGTFLFDLDPGSQEEWPPDTYLLSSIVSQSGRIHHDIRDSMSEFTSFLLSKFNSLYLSTRERTDIQTPFDPASDLVVRQSIRSSAFALEDAHATPAPSPSPGPERQSRFSNSVLPAPNLERAKMLGYGRACKICGDLLLICGFSNEAMRQYTEAAAIAKANNDYMWQGVALEGIGVCLVLLTYLEVNFQIPSVALSSTTVQRPPRTLERQSISSQKADVNLIDFLPDLHSTIIDLYQKSISSQTDQIPPFVLAESSLRIAKLLAVVHLSGSLDNKALTHIILGEAIPPAARTVATFPPRAEIAAWAMRAYQGPIESLSLADKLHIYSGLASVLGAIKFYRRRALFLREIVLALIPALVQARVAGAAGMGIHPAASLALSENTTFSREVLMRTRQSASSLSSLLESLSSAYGIPGVRSTTNAEQSLLSGYGWPSLQGAVLKECIAISEAIPDFEAVLQFSKRTLEMTSAMMGRDEQVRMVSNVPRIIGAAKRSGVLNLEIEYWDRYLVREVAIGMEGNIPVKRRTQELLAVDSAAIRKDPFLYNPYSKKTAQKIEAVMVENEPAIIAVTLQNPFEFDIEAQAIELSYQGVQLDCEQGQTFVKALSSQVVTIQATSKSAGELKITGCRIKVTGCRETVFNIKRTPTKTDLDNWHLERGGVARTKRFGVLANVVSAEQQSDRLLVPDDEVLVQVLPAAPILLYRPPNHQPIPTITLLEGEESIMNIQLHNSSSTPVTFIAISFTDSTTKPLELAISARNKQTHEIYELETFLYKRRAMTYQTSKNAHRIDANSSKEFEIALRGKRGFTSGEMIVNYGYLPVPSPNTSQQDSNSQVPEEFFTRQLTIPCRATVIPALDIIHCDIIPVPSSPSLSDTRLKGLDKQFGAIKSVVNNIDDYCLMIMDLRNVHVRDLTMSLQIYDLEQDHKPYELSELIVAGTQHRFVLPLKRIHLSVEQSNTPVPSLSSRQFVLSAGADADLFTLEMFWAREELLSRLSIRWTSHDRDGEVEKRSIAINRRMLQALLVTPLRIALSSGPKGQAPVYKTDDDFSLILKVTNDTPDQFVVFIRIQITLASTGEVEGGNRLILNGLSQYPLVVKANSVKDEDLSLISMNSGRYKVAVSMEVVEGPRSGEIRLARESEIIVED